MDMLEADFKDGKPLSSSPPPHMEALANAIKGLRENFTGLVRLTLIPKEELKEDTE